jgi:hypothetical protein
MSGARPLLHPDAVGWGLDRHEPAGPAARLTAFRLRSKTGRTLWDGGSFRPRAGGVYVFSPGEVMFSPQRFWKSPMSLASYPVEWIVRTPADFYSVRAVIDNQELDSRASTGAIYWEGLSELRGLQRTTGRPRLSGDDRLRAAASPVVGGCRPKARHSLPNCSGSRPAPGLRPTVRQSFETVLSGDNHDQAPSSSIPSKRPLTTCSTPFLVTSSSAFRWPLASRTPFVNALYRRIKANPARKLRIITALSLIKPVGKSELEQHFLEPLVERVFADYPDLEYAVDLRAHALPPNIEVREFFMKTGDYIGNEAAQQNYISTNYTFVARDMAVQGMNVIAQAVGAQGEADDLRLSMSSNPDIVCEVVENMRAAGQPLLKVAVINRKMPFMPNGAELSPDFYDVVVTDPAATHVVFGPPNNKVSAADYAIGLHASSLVTDGGTLQIGIGSLGDAIAQALIVRDRHGRGLSQHPRNPDPGRPGRAASSAASTRACTAARKCSSMAS